jgi:DNA-directed RNA polymerase specialized sigma24 family protein
VKSIDSANTIKKNDDALRAIFESYGSALLGYIVGIVNDKTKAEDYLVEIFKVTARFADELIHPDVNTWLRLQQITKNFLYNHKQAALTEVDLQLVAAEQSNKYLNLLTADQKHVFCGIHYRNKSVQALANEMRTDENSVRRCLRAALSVIRNG